MRLVEKKCPNCGANLEFSETDKSCKCQYCHRAFEIERDQNLNVSDLADQFNLSELSDSFVKTSKFIFIPFIIGMIIFIVIFVFIFAMAFRSIVKHENKSSSIFSQSEEVSSDEKLLKDVSELTNDSLEDLDFDARSVVSQSVIGRRDTTYSYQQSGDERLEKIYVAYKKDSNYIVSIYKLVYHNFFNQSDQQTVYVPAVFENVPVRLSAALAYGKNPAPEYYFNEEHSSYIYAYKSLEDAYNDIIKPLEEKGYKITEK